MKKKTFTCSTLFECKMMPLLPSEFPVKAPPLVAEFVSSVMNPGR